MRLTSLHRVLLTVLGLAAALLPTEAASDRFGDELPASAQARLGTVRFRHDGWVSSIAFSRDGKFLVSGGADGVVRFWDVAAKAPTREIQTGSPVESLAISPDGNILGTGCYDKTISLWSLSTGELIRKLTGPLSEVISIAFSMDGQILGAAARNKNGASGENVRLWKVSTGEPVTLLEKDVLNVLTIVFSPDG